MIDLDFVRRAATTVLMLVFLVLWQVSEHNTRRALRIAATTTDTTAQCVATYGQAATDIGNAVDDLTTALRAE